MECWGGGVFCWADVDIREARGREGKAGRKEERKGERARGIISHVCLHAQLLKLVSSRIHLLLLGGHMGAAAKLRHGEKMP